MHTIFLGFAIAAALTSVVVLILIMAALDRRGHKTNFLLARLFAFRYIADYRETTRKETGKPGILYRLWCSTIAVELLAVLAAGLSWLLWRG